VVVRDFDAICISTFPAKTDTILFVDANTVLSDPVPPQPLKPISGWRRKFQKVAHAIELVKPTPSARPQEVWTDPTCRSGIGAVEDVFRATILEGAYHESQTTLSMDNGDEQHFYE